MESIDKTISVNAQYNWVNDIFKPFFVKVLPIHIATWCLYIIVAAFDYITDLPSLLSNTYILINIFYAIPLFYLISLGILPALQQGLKNWRSSVALLGILIILIALKILITYRYANTGYTMSQTWSHEFKRIFQFTLLGLGFWGYILLRNLEKIFHMLRLEHKKLEIVTTHNRLHPHFLFNTLNNLVSDIYPISKSLANDLVTICSILRQGIKGSVQPLSNEVQGLKNYVSINQKRIKSHIQILDNTQYLEAAHNLFIPSLVLITFIENIFSHGAVYSPNHEIIIYLDLHEKEDSFQFHFRYSNPIKNLKNKNTLGTGINKSKELLDYHFNDRYTLHTNIIDQQFHFNLTIQYEKEKISSSINR